MTNGYRDEDKSKSRVDEICRELKRVFDGDWEFHTNMSEDLNVSSKNFMLYIDIEKYDYIMVPEAYALSGKRLRGDVAVFIRNKEEHCPACGSNKIISATRNDCGNSFKFCDCCKKVITF